MTTPKCSYCGRQNTVGTGYARVTDNSSQCCPACGVPFESLRESLSRFSDSDLDEAEQLAREFGSSNCWTGTTGTLAGVILKYVNEIRRIKATQTVD